MKSSALIAKLLFFPQNFVQILHYYADENKFFLLKIYFQDFLRQTFGFSYGKPYITLRFH